MDKVTEEVEVKGWGLGAKFSGPQVTCVAVLLILGAVVTVMLYQHNASANESMAAVAKAQEAVKAELQASRETQEAMIYVMSLKQEEREKLNLLRPKRLVDMQR